MTVAILDTGVNPDHPALTNTYRGGPDDWYDPYAGTTLPSDYLDNGLAHGTAVTSLVLGRSVLGETVGVAPDAQWIAARIFPVSGAATNADIVITSYSIHYTKLYEMTQS